MNEGRYLVFDVGGTECKCGIMDTEGRLVEGITSFPSHAQESADVLLDHFANRIQMLAAGWKSADGNAFNPQVPVDIRGTKDNLEVQNIQEVQSLQEITDVLGLQNPNVLGIGMAFPGPFDYENGISLMQGLEKYDQLYGVSIPAGLRERLPWLAGIPIVFLHDIEAFALGESWFGEAKDEEKLLCLCIGTGAGSAFVQNHQVLKEANDQVPENGWIYNHPYQDSIIDEYLSVRGLARISKQYYSKPITGWDLYQLSRDHEANALQVFKRFGEDVSQAMLVFLDGFKPNGLVLGGQISRSFCYFGQELAQECQKRHIQIYQEPNTSLRAMQGLYVSMKKGACIC